MDYFKFLKQCYKKDPTLEAELEEEFRKVEQEHLKAKIGTQKV